MSEKEVRVRFDRATGRLTTSDFRSWTGVQLMRLAERAVAPFGYVGISRLHATVGRVFPAGSITEIGLAGGGTFAYPSGDYYWNRLLTTRWDYEEDIQSILKSLAGIRYTLLDIGANFGFFSCLAASPSFGSQRVVAVEPAQIAFSFLEKNLESYPDRAKLLNLAIDEKSGDKVTLYGDRHAGFSLSSEWYGASSIAQHTVSTISIDDMVADARLGLGDTPLLVKLEVEGIEMRALRGARRTIEGDVAFIIEEVNPSGISEATRFVFNELKLAMYYADEKKEFTRITSLDGFEAYRKGMQGIQLRGSSILAFRDERWLDRFSAILR